MISNTPLIIGHRSVWGGEIPFVIQPEDARFHTYIIGKTGSGKTTLLRNLILQHIQLGHGIAIIDPHGDLAEELLHHIPPRRTDDLVYFNPGVLEFPIGFNPLANVPPDERPLVASGVVDAFKAIWEASAAGCARPCAPASQNRPSPAPSLTSWAGGLTTGTHRAA